MKQQGRADDRIEDTHVVFSFGYGKGLENAFASHGQLSKGLSSDTDVFPIGHVGGRKHFSTGVKQPKEDFLFTGSLSFQRCHAGHGIDSLCGQQRRKHPGLLDQILIDLLPQNVGDEKIK